ncbi:DUF4368 domain-containing protein [Clostridioides difficile]
MRYHTLPLNSLKTLISYGFLLVFLMGEFITLIDKYKDFDTMTATMLNKFVEKIFVHERDRKCSQESSSPL